MAESWVKEYFSFSRRERIAVVALLAIIGILSVLPHFLDYDSRMEGLKDYLAQDSSISKVDDSSGTEQSGLAWLEPAAKEEKTKVELFYFDPNTLNAEGWKKLGLKNRTITTIMKYREKGGRFRKPGDIRKVYGLTSLQVDRLIPYIILPSSNPKNPNSDNGDQDLQDLRIKQDKKELATIDINTANAEELEALPGIGPTLANRIIKFRDKLGGFHKIDQIGETYGLPDSVFRMIEPKLICTPSLKKININTASAEELKDHPYIKWHLANAIVQYRLQHGNFQSIEQLKSINIVTEEVFTKLAPYLTVGE